VEAGPPVRPAAVRALRIDVARRGTDRQPHLKGLRLREQAASGRSESSLAGERGESALACANSPRRSRGVFAR
jgi:hypothetical protein